jgi:ADP-ribose pyrophosphatase YjhB (NUDIX family)
MTPVARFCSACSAPLVERVIEQRARRVCTACDAVAYRNPHIVVSTIVVAAGRVLLCRRALAPAAGFWALPGGFMECGEALEEAAARETFEETGVRLDAHDLRLHALSTLPDLDEVYAGFHVALEREPATACGPECAEVRFFEEAQVPWDELAYPEIGNYLRVYFAERAAGAFAIHLSRLDPTSVVGHTYRVAGVDDVRIVRPPDWRRR